MEQNKIVIAVHPKYFREGLVDEVANGSIPKVTLACRIDFFWSWLYDHGFSNSNSRLLRRASTEQDAAQKCSQGLAQMCITNEGAVSKYSLQAIGYFSNECLEGLEAEARRGRRNAIEKRKRMWG